MLASAGRAQGSTGETKAAEGVARMTTTLAPSNNDRTTVLLDGATIADVWLREPKSYPSIRHISSSDAGGHDVLLVRWSPTEQDLCCGHSACDGACGLPALVIPIEQGELRARNSYGAVCCVFVMWRDGWPFCRLEEWAGERLAVPEGHRDVMTKFMW
jgi:hypothetical protein